jgi:hypothetical protein
MSSDNMAEHKINILQRRIGQVQEDRERVPEEEPGLQVFEAEIQKEPMVEQKQREGTSGGRELKRGQH